MTRITHPDTFECDICRCEMNESEVNRVIAPSERTCKRRNHDTDNYYMRCCSCSRCNAGWFEDIYDKPFSYCPHCGAKVVES